MSSRTNAAREYMVRLLLEYTNLEKEQARLEAAEARLIEIAAEKAELVADAQEALAKYNALNGTSYTLAQVRAQLQPVP